MWDWFVVIVVGRGLGGEGTSEKTTVVQTVSKGRKEVVISGQVVLDPKLLPHHMEYFPKVKNL